MLFRIIKNKLPLVILSVIGGGFLIFMSVDWPSSGTTETPLPSVTPKSSQEILQEEVEALRNQVDALKNQKPQVIIKQVSQPQQPAPATADISSIVQAWRPRVAYIECDFKYSDTGRIYQSQGGSGFLNMTFVNLGSSLPSVEYSVVTNRHVINDQDGNIATTCRVKLPNSPTAYEINNVAYGDSPFSTSATGLDWGTIELKPDVYLRDAIFSHIPKESSVCKRQPAVGDQILILGYPAIGSKTDITVTDGIVSGFDGNYFITSAKIEHGNSGGAAISVKDDCYLGIPSYVVTGTIESLARVLNANVVFKQ